MYRANPIFCRYSQNFHSAASVPCCTARLGRLAAEPQIAPPEAGLRLREETNYHRLPQAAAAVVGTSGRESGCVKRRPSTCPLMSPGGGRRQSVREAHRNAGPGWGPSSSCPRLLTARIRRSGRHGGGAGAAHCRQCRRCQAADNLRTNQQIGQGKGLSRLPRSSLEWARQPPPPGCPRTRSGTAEAVGAAAGPPVPLGRWRQPAPCLPSRASRVAELRRLSGWAGRRAVRPSLGCHQNAPVHLPRRGHPRGADRLMCVEIQRNHGSGGSRVCECQQGSRANSNRPTAVVSPENSAPLRPSTITLACENQRNKYM